LLQFRIGTIQLLHKIPLLLSQLLRSLPPLRPHHFPPVFLQLDLSGQLLVAVDQLLHFLPQPMGSFVQLPVLLLCCLHCLCP
jgi:hypothetical protein